MKYWTFTVFSVLSLLLSVAVGMSWVGARDEQSSLFRSVRSPWGRIVVECRKGGLSLIAGPAAGGEGEVKVREQVKLMRNGNVEFWCRSNYFKPDEPEGAQHRWGPQPNPMGLLEQLRIDRTVQINDFRRPLLEALEDPERFVAAHVQLTQLFGSMSWELPVTPRDGAYEVAVDGLTIMLPPPKRLKTEHRYLGPPGRLYWVYRVDKGGVKADLSKLALIRDSWNAGLGRRLPAVPYWVLIVLLLLAPGAWTFREMRRRWRLARSQCGNCGYDLRATPGRCPECGRVVGEGKAMESGA